MHIDMQRVRALKEEERECIQDTLGIVVFVMTSLLHKECNVSDVMKTYCFLL